MSDYPYAKPFKDRHGHTRWRFRHKGKDKYLPGEPGSPEFHEAYTAVLEGRKPRVAKIHRFPNSVEPRSFEAAWRLVLKSPEWRALEAATVTQNTRLAQEFLALRVDPNSPETWGQMQVSDLRRRHVRALLSDFSETPHKVKRWMKTGSSTTPRIN
jgi:hypothetical protein